MESASRQVDNRSDSSLDDKHFDFWWRDFRPGLGHICVLELKHGADIGGRARCWGDEDDSGKTSPPTDVRACNYLAVQWLSLCYHDGNLSLPYVIRVGNICAAGIWNIFHLWHNNSSNCAMLGTHQERRERSWSIRSNHCQRALCMRGENWWHASLLG